MFAPRFLTLVALCAAVVAAPAWAQTTVKDAWVRGTVPAQKATGAFMQITSIQGGKLVSAASPVAGTVEIHEMKMEGDVMKMAAVSGLDLPAGKTVELKPGGYHVMLLDLKQQLKDGDVVPFSVTVEGKDGQKDVVTLRIPVRALGAPGMSGHEGMKH